MKTVKLVILSFALAFIFQTAANAQDAKADKKAPAAKEAVQDKSSCSDKAVSSCCGSSAAAKETVTPWNTVCPVMGNEVDASVKTVEYDGKNYGFCCGGCDSKFQKDPARYSRNLSKDGTKFSKTRS
jgi:YHS domain-containing protein